MWTYTIDPNADEPIMLILQQIGNTVDENGNITEYGINGAEFCRELLQLDAMGKKRIQIWINSVGGSVVDGYSILGGILKSKTPVDTVNVGVAASTALWLYCAGKNREWFDYAIGMGHNPYSETEGADDLTQKMRASIATITAARSTSKDIVDVYEMMDATTYFNAEEAQEFGIVDKIVLSDSTNKKRVTSANTITDKHRAALQIVNKIVDNKKSQTMADDKKFPLIVNKLNAFRPAEDKLHEAASEAMLVEAIDGIYNRAAIAEETLKNKNVEFEKLTKSKDTLQEQYNSLKVEMDKITKKQEEDEAKNNLDAATAMVNKYAELGKIENKDEEKNAWIDMAKESKEAFNRVDARLKALPVNKEAKKIEVVNTITGNGGPKNIDQRMLEIAKKNGQRK